VLRGPPSEMNVSKSVFISHAVKDKELVKEIVGLIEEGMGVPEEEIFCSSLDGYGIPNGKNFVTHIKDQLLEPKVVVLVLTPAYFESKFCLSKLGAAWIKSHDIFPILVPPLQYSDVKDVLLGTQVSKVDDDIKYNELLTKLTETVAFKRKSQTKWDLKRRAFLKAIEPMLKNIEGPSVVSAADHKKLIDKLAEAEGELDSLEEENRLLKEQLVKTEALKDKADLATLKAAYGDNGLSEQFLALTDQMKELLSELRSAEIKKFVLCDHYGKAYSIDWFHNREEFERADQYGFIKISDGHERPIWSKQKMKQLKQKLDELDAFVAQNQKGLQASYGDDVPLEPGDQDFWDQFYR